jgi:predicted phosphodiesterase
MRIFAVSDLHSDFRENWALLEALSSTRYRRDVLIVAGDIAHQIAKIEDTLTLLRSKFSQVFYLPGNHELWVRGEYQDSIEKMNEILELCERLDIRTAPQRVDSIWIVPLFSWYDESLNHGPAGDDEELEAWGDFRFCRWPDGLGSVVDYMLRLNAPRIRSYDGRVVSFSHFLPRRELLPRTEVLVFKGLPKVAGSISLDRQIRALSPEVHVFGHSHINCDKVIDGVRYVQNALLYPREREALTSVGRVFWKGGGPLLQVAATGEEAAGS